MIKAAFNRRFFGIASIAVLFWAGLWGTAAAQVLDVQFEQNPLFSNIDIAPSFETSRTVMVTNQGTTTEEVYVSVANVAQGGLEDAMTLVIDDGITTYFNDTFATFFTPDPVALGNLTGGETRTYTFTAALDDAKGNEYQNKSMGFALVVGFKDGDSVADTDGGGGGGGKRTLSDDDPDLPEGRIAGESTSTLPTIFDNSITRPFIDFLAETVLGETANATTGTSSQIIDSGDAAPDEETPSGVALADGLLDNINCTFVWLLLLLLISLSWSLIEDRFGKQSGILGSFFTRNAIFGLVYVVLLLLCLFAGLLDAIWHLFAGTWAIMTSVDYYSHKKVLPEWSARRRNIYFAGAGFIFAVISFATSLLCVWIPFVVIALIATLLAFIDA